MKRISLIFVLLLAVQLISAQTANISVSKEKALEYGMQFIKAQFPNAEKSDLKVKSYEALKGNDGIDCFHAFNFENGGFVIVGADKRCAPVLGFSDEGEFNFEDCAPATREWINRYIGAIETARIKGIALTEKSENSWNATKVRSNHREVETLVATRWSQEYPYNMHCPEHPQGSEGRCYTGCVATAMGQLMKYFNYPERGAGLATYFWGDWVEVDLSQTAYDWENMPNILRRTSTEAQKEAVSTLLYHAGVTVNMNYGYEASGSQTEYVPSALRQYFGYRSGINFKNRDDGTDLLVDNDTIWARILQEELDMSRPMIYSGQSAEQGGHAWICDGYRTDETYGNYYHMNWGWGGANDGYFWIDKYSWMSGDESFNDFNAGQGAVLFVGRPEDPFCNATETNVYEEEYWTIDDGSGPNFYQKNTNCDWLIKIKNFETDTVMLVFKRFELGDGDALKMYAGEDANGTLLNTFVSGEEPVDTIYHVGTPIYLEFISDGESQALGWSLYYEALRYPFTITTSVAGVGGQISPEGTTKVMKDATVIVRMTPNAGYAVSQFVIDGSLTFSGSENNGEVAYTFATVDANHSVEVRYAPAAIESESVSAISVFPNPNSGKFSVAVNSENASYSLYDMSGRVIEENNVNGNSINFDLKLEAGTYFLKVVSNEVVSIEKIVIE